MSTAATGTTVTPLATYRNETPYPFCPGCGHSTILDRLNDALVDLGRDPSEIVLVSDIGCSGLSDQYFVTSAFHGLHGRAVTYATGIKLARPELEVIVVMGDGGTGIGGAHLLNAARRNIGITVLVFNNFNYGMTGGQHSATTPPGAITSTTPGGNLERPLDLCATVAANGAAYTYRGTSFDGSLAERIADGIRAPGFALLDIWELCTAHFVPGNKASKRTLSETLDRLGFDSGVIRRPGRPEELPEYSAAYRAAHGLPPAGVPSGGARPSLGPEVVEPRFRARLDRRFELVVAGAAGGKVRSAARTVARAAVLSGLWAAQRDDYPVTVKTGHSVAHLILSPQRIEHPGSSGRPDAVLVLAEEGGKKVAGLLSRMEEGSDLFVLPAFEALDAGGAARHVLYPEASAEAAGVKISRDRISLFALAATVARLDQPEAGPGLFPPEALEEAVRQGPPELTARNLAAVRAGIRSGNGAGTGASGGPGG